MNTKNKFGASLVLSLVLLGGCTTPAGYVNVSQIEPAILIVTERHDGYVKADPTKTPADKETELRTSKLLREILTEAKKTVK